MHRWMLCQILWPTLQTLRLHHPQILTFSLRLNCMPGLPIPNLKVRETDGLPDFSPPIFEAVCPDIRRGSHNRMSASPVSLSGDQFGGSRFNPPNFL